MLIGCAKADGIPFLGMDVHTAHLDEARRQIYDQEWPPKCMCGEFGPDVEANSEFSVPS